MSAMGASFLLNQLCDVESDLKNKKLFLLSENHITKKEAKIETAILIILSFLLAAWVNISVLITVIGFVFITGYIYNYKPFAYKDKPLGSLVANALMGWLAFAIGWLTVNQLGWGVVIESAPYLFFNTALYFFTTLPDIPGDKASNKATLAVLHGKDFVIYLALACFVLSLATAFLLNDNFALLFIGLSIPFFILTAAKKDVITTIKTTKYTLLFFAVAICIKIPFYFVLIISIFAFTKWYFKNRFNYDYPNFKGA